MAMIIDLGLPGQDVERIAEFMRTGGEVPELEGDSAKILDELTGGKSHPLWNAVIGTFVEYEDRTFHDGVMGRRDGFYVAPDGEHVRHADSLQGDDGPSGKWGVVVENFEEPEAAYVVGVPL